MSGAKGLGGSVNPDDAEQNRHSAATPGRRSFKVSVRRIAEPYEMEAENESGWRVRIDSAPAGGGSGNGVRPNELLVMGLAGCSGIDIISILNKQRQVVRRFDVELEAERDYTQVPAILVAIHAHYIFDGEIETEKARRAIELSLDKYCSVSKVLRKTASITYSFSVNGERHE